jgi:hypothetical protein
MAVDSSNVINLHVGSGNSDLLSLVSANGVPKCLHKHVIVSEEESEVTCEDCGTKLNPIYVLGRMAREESRWEREGRRIIEARKMLSERSRCKCQHCGKITHINLK